MTEGLLTEVSEKRKGHSRCCNPSGRRPNFIGRQHLTFDKGGKCGGARRGRVVLLQWLWEWSGLVQREGQARQVIGVLLQRLAKTTRIGATGGASPLPYEKRVG